MRRLLFCGICSSKWGVVAIVLLWPAMLSSQPVWSWAEGMDDGNDQEGFAIAVDDNNDNISTGYFKGTVNFDGNVVTSGGNEDIYIAKYDSSGNGIWAVGVNGNSADYGYGIAVDVAGNIYVCGSIGDNATFFGSPNVSIGNYGGDDIFLAKYNPAGQVLWAKHAGSGGNDAALSVCTDGNSVYITGYYTATATFGALAPLISNGGDDIFVAAYSCSGGIEQWAVSGGSTGNDVGDGIAVDSSGVYIAGHFDNGSCTFQNHSGSLASNGGTDIFLVKYNLAGTAGIWKRRAGSSNNDEGKCVTVRDNFVFVGGFFAGTMSMYNAGPAVATITAAGNNDAFLAQYDATTGNFSWVRSENGTGDDKTYEICTDPFGGVYATGYWNGTLPFGSGPSVTSNNRDVFVTAYDMSGNFLYGMRAAGNSEEEGKGICASVYKDVFITGYYASSNTQFGNTPQLGNNNDDIFIAKMSCDVTISNAGSDQNVCSSTYSLNGNTPLNGFGTWTLISGAGNILTPFLPGSTITGLGIGPNVFRWTIVSGVCVSFDEVVITRYAPPTSANAGSNQTVCSTAVTLNANTPSSGTGVWSLVSGAGTITNPSSPSTTVSGLAAGQNVFEWSISNFSCAVSRDTVVIQSDAMPTSAFAGTDQTICSTNSVLNGNSPTVGSGVWNLVSGSGTISSPTSSNSSVANLAIGQSVFVWTISNGVCPSSSDSVTFIVDAVPTSAAAGSDHTRCALNDTLSGNVPLIGFGTWSLISGSGTIAAPNSPITTVTSLGAGLNEFVWTISNGICPDSKDTIAVTRDDFPTLASAGADENNCSDFDTLAGNIPLVGNGTWSVIGGTSSLNNPQAPVCTVNNLSAGQNIFVWTISNGSCASEQDTVVIVYNQAPDAANAGPDLFACGEQLSLLATIPLIGIGTWQSVNGSPAVTDINNPNSSLPVLNPGTWSYLWTTQNGFCISSPDTVHITVYSPPDIAIAGSDIISYINNVQLIANPVDTGIGTWTFVQGSGNIADIHDPFTHVSDLSPGTNILRWTCSNGTCPENADDLRVEIMQLVIPEGFSPNGDGVNDNFEITGLNDFPSPTLEVFNRWGNQVFISQSYEVAWNGSGQDGSQLPDDVYYYVLKADTENVFTGYVVIKRSLQ